MLSLANMAGSVAAGCAAVVLGAALAQGIVQPTWSRLPGMRQSRPSESIEVEVSWNPAEGNPHVVDRERSLASETDLGEIVP